MREKIRPRVLLVLFLCISFGLSSALIADEYGDAKKAYQNGQNDEALRLLVIKLRKDNSHQDAIALFKTVLKLVIDTHQTAAQDFESTKDWDNARKEYDILDKVGKDIASINPMEEVRDSKGKKVKQPLSMPKIDVRAQRENARNNAAQSHYDKAVLFANTPGSSDKAATEFDAAMRYIPDYKDSRQLAAECLYNDGVVLYTKKDYKGAFMKFRSSQVYVPEFRDSAALAAKAKQAALQRIAVMPFNNLSGKKEFGDVGRILTDRLISEALGTHPDFLEFVTLEFVEELLQQQASGQPAVINEANAARFGKMAGIYAFVFGKVLSITVSYPPEIAQNGTSTASVYPGPVTIIANWRKHRVEGYAEVSGSYQIIDVGKGTIVHTESITKRMEDSAQWVTYTGDERAIEPSVKAYQTTGQRALEPAEQLVKNALEGIANELAGKLALYFR